MLNRNLALQQYTNAYSNTGIAWKLNEKLIALLNEMKGNG